VVDLDAPAGDNILKLAKAKGVRPENITALILDRPRHADMIAAVRKVGAAVCLITDGDVAGVIHTAEPDSTGIDIHLGIGGAPEGVLAAAALRCIGGQMQCRLILDTEERRVRAAKMASPIHACATEIEDMVKGDCLFAATGDRRRHAARCEFRRDIIETETVVMRSVTGTVRRIPAEHRQAREVSSGLIASEDPSLYPDEGAGNLRLRACRSARRGIFISRSNDGSRRHKAGRCSPTDRTSYRSDCRHPCCIGPGRALVLVIAAPLPGLLAAIPVQTAWPVACACRRTCAAPNRADRCSPTVGMTCGWHRPDNRTEPVAARLMMLELLGGWSCAERPSVLLAARASPCATNREPAS
jgi:hypothetical protein